MKAKLIHDGDGTAEMIRTAEESDLLPEELSFRDGGRPRSASERRAVLSEIERTVNRPMEEAFEDYCRRGKDALAEERAQAVGTDSAGGYLTPASFADRFTVSLAAYDALFDVATLVETDKGTAFGYPTDDDTAAVATIVAENAVSLTNSPVTFDNVNFGRCPQWRSGKIVGSMELAADSAFPLTDILAGMFARRFARGVGAQFVTNLIADSDVGVTTAATGAATGDEILDLVASVDSAYSQNGGFLMRNATLTALRKLKASTGGDYLLPISRDGAGRPTLFDFPVYLSPGMPALGAGNKPIAFGDLSRFVRRQVRNSLAVKMYSELFATSGQFGWEAFLRVDGKLSKAANSPLPIRLLACHT